MTRYLLDTNIVSEATRPRPSAPLLEWMADQADTDLFISALTVGEFRRGVFEARDRRRKARLEEWFFGPEGPQALFAGRVLAFDDRAALVWGRLMSEDTVAGRPRSAIDMIITATAEANDCVVVTAIERDFVGLRLLNPLRGTPRGSR